MPTVPRILAVALAVACAAGLSGCDVDEPDPSPSASTSADEEPVFASEEEALAAATEAYAAYLAASDAITSGRSTDFDDVSEVLTDDYAATEVDGLAAFMESGNRTEGASRFDSLRLQSAGGDLTDGEVLTSYLCSDISAVVTLNQQGVDVTPERDDRLPLEVDFTVDEDARFRLLIDRSEVWSGTNFC